MRKFKVTIKGKTPYMQHRMDDTKLKEWEKSRGRIIENQNLNTEPEKMAMFHAYTDDDGKYYFPVEHLEQCFIKGGGFVKGKVGNSTRSMKNIVAGMWLIEGDRIPFRKFDTVDTRSAVNNNVKGRVIVHRPRWEKWEVSFVLQVDDEDKGKNLLSNVTIRDIMENGGRFVGVGSYRPEHTGKFGRFEITHFEEIITKKST